MARRALKIAGDPDLVLDLPCGAGRFWPLLAEHPSRMIFAADNSADMLAIAEGSQSREILYRVESFQTRSEEHTSELQSLMRISYAVFCLKKKNKIKSTK